MKETFTFSQNQNFVAKKFEAGVLKGTIIEAEAMIRPLRMAKDETAIHEALHVEASQSSGGIVMASILPDTSTYSLGRTIPVKLTLANIGAAMKFDPKGSSHDLRLAKYKFGASYETAANAGDNENRGKERRVNEIAVMLEDKKEITQTDVTEAHERVYNRDNGMYDTFFRIISPDGTFKLMQKAAKNNKVDIDHKEILQFKAHTPKSKAA